MNFQPKQLFLILNSLIFLLDIKKMFNFLIQYKLVLYTAIIHLVH